MQLSKPNDTDPKSPQKKSKTRLSSETGLRGGIKRFLCTVVPIVSQIRLFLRLFRGRSREFAPLSLTLTYTLLEPATEGHMVLVSQSTVQMCHCQGSAGTI